MALLPVSDALAHIVDGVTPTSVESVPIGLADNRVLAAHLDAQRTQPPWATSAMDGYAVRGEDVRSNTTLRLIGEAAAGHAFDGIVGPGETVRIFTGAPLPEGADTIVMQENVETDGDLITVPETPTGRFVRPKGLDFAKGDTLLRTGDLLTPTRIALAAAMGHANVTVHRKPVFAILSTGDELVLPGQEAGPDQIVASNNYAVASMLRGCGAASVDLGIAPDDPDIIAAKLRGAISGGADAIVTTGGASVGKHDFIQDVLKSLNVEIGFWKIAMRPGKPLMFGTLNEMKFIGLPGNPVSAIVCARLFLVPLVRAFLGQPGINDMFDAELGADLSENDHRQDYMRATLITENGKQIAMPFSRQDSSMLATLGRASALIVRPPGAPAAKSGEKCQVMPLLPPN